MSLRIPAARLLLALTAFLLIASARPAEASCEGQVFFRLWFPGGEEWWYDAGEEIELEPGTEAHLYVHVVGRGENTYTTSARIGYPGEFGYDGDARVVERSVAMKAQNEDDRGSGRLRFRTNQENLVYLGYQITGVKSPGSLNNVPNNCRVGYIPIRVAYSEEE